MHKENSDKACYLTWSFLHTHSVCVDDLLALTGKVEGAVGVVVVVLLRGDVGYHDGMTRPTDGILHTHSK